MIPFLALVRKDLRLFFSDRKAVLVGLLVPIVCGSFFGYLFGGQKGNTETSKVPVLIIDQDNSAISRAIAAQLGTRAKPSERARPALPSWFRRISVQTPGTLCLGRVRSPNWD